MGYITKKTNNGKVVKLKNYKRRAKINKIKRKLLLIVLLLIVLVIILLFAPFMKIKNIVCTGNLVIPTEEIISSSSIKVGSNIFRINKYRAINKINDNSYIKTVEIDRKLPSTINIIVEECQVMAYILKNKDYIYIDETGKVLEVSQTPPADNKPIISGVNVVKYDINDFVELKNTEQLENYKKIIDVLSNSGFGNIVTHINLKDCNDIKININNKLEIIIGDISDIDYKINFLAKGAYDNLGSTGSGTLNVSYGKAVYKENKIKE